MRVGGGAETTAHDGTPVEFPLGLEGRRSRLHQGRGDQCAEEEKPGEHTEADLEAVGDGEGAGCLYLGVRVDVRTSGPCGECAVVSRPPSSTPKAATQPAAPP